MADLPELRHELAAFAEALSREKYQVNSGQKAALNLGPIYRRWGFLFSRDLIRALKARLANGELPDEGNLRLLYRRIVHGWIELRRQDTEEAIQTAEAGLTVDVAGRSMPYRSLTPAIVRSPDRAEGDALAAAKSLAEASLVPLYREHWARYFAAVEELGYSSPLALETELQGLDYPTLGATLQTLLSETEPRFRSEFATLQGQPLHEAQRAMRAPGLDPLFPADQLVPVLERFTAGFGVPFAELPAIHLDLEERPTKRPRAFCANVRPGQEIYLTMRPSGGLKDTLTLLHEAGHALHFAHLDPALPIECQRFGDRAISEGFAFLCNYLPENPEFCAEVLGFDNPEPVMAQLQRERLWMLRRYASKLHYELEFLQASGPDGFEQIYQSSLEAALGVVIDPVESLIDLDVHLYCADYLRAWIWERQLRTELESQYGLGWFADPQACGFVQELWALGFTHDADGLARSIGLDGLNPEPLRAGLLAGLRPPARA